MRPALSMMNALPLWPISSEALYPTGYYDEAMRYCSLPPVGVDQYDQETLSSRRRFYAEVYKPRRDALVEDWTDKYAINDED